MPKKIEHEYTTQVTCPYCGYEHKDSWEFVEDCDEMDCYRCEKEFLYIRNITVNFSTEKI